MVKRKRTAEHSRRRQVLLTGKEGDTDYPFLEESKNVTF
jgi:hypothetical protein